MDFPPVDIGPTRIISSHSGVLIKEKDFQYRLRKTSIYTYGTEYYEASEVNRCIAHHKYKRCLAMAMWCDAERDIFNLTPKVTKVEFFARWHKRWLEIATKFKEAK